MEFKAILDANSNDKAALSSACSLVIASVGYLAQDIRGYAAKGSGLRRKEWHTIIREIATISDDARYIRRNGQSTTVKNEFDKKCLSIEKKIRELGEL